MRGEGGGWEILFYLKINKKKRGKNYDELKKSGKLFFAILTVVIAFIAGHYYFSTRYYLKPFS